MAILRFKALELAQNRELIDVVSPSSKVSDYYSTNVFGAVAMKKHLSSEAYKKLDRSIEYGEAVDKSTAESVATAMKNWAMEKGVTHYTHWFQPLTGSTAEKHDAFFHPTQDGRAIEKFNVSALVQQEPDASSFPNGGIRNTFEARGYSAWDPTSPAFIMENGNLKTLCIPTVFVSYTGEALDFKVPLLKSLDLVGKAAVDVCQFFDKNVTKVSATLGIEQEFFLVDSALYNARPDLVMSGRSVVGHEPAKGQQLSDHYFGSIPVRVERFMQDFEIEAYKLGIPIRTRHNEVAPGQFECAPTFEEVNLAIDHNLLLMDVMEKVARRHHLKVLFHEKPFEGVNGSGKHNNWSLSTNTGKNLFEPSSKAKENLWFLTFVVNTVMAVYEHADLLRASIASASNDHRLGAHEAPPAIMSIFLGSEITAVLEELETNAKVEVGKGENMYMKLGLDKIPNILLDNTDRNRTSPFAFTGNKFEFRAVGSSANSSSSMVILNTIVADRLAKFKVEVDAQVESGIKKETAIINILRDYVIASKAIRFEGDGYSDEWVQEAAKRGLSNVTDTPRALDAYLTTQTKNLFLSNKIYMKDFEMEARSVIMLENYVMKLQIESRVLGYLALNHIVPSAIGYQNVLIQNIKGLMDLGMESQTSERMKFLKQISVHIETIKEKVQEMKETRKSCNSIESPREKAIAYCDRVKPYFEEIRYHCDRLELVVDDEMWGLPKYRELLFLK